VVAFVYLQIMSSAMERRQMLLKPQSKSHAHASEEHSDPGEETGEDARGGADHSSQGGGTREGGGSVGHELPVDLEKRLQRMEAMISSVHAAVLGGGGPVTEQARRLEQMEAMISSVHAVVTGGSASVAAEVEAKELSRARELPSEKLAPATPAPDNNSLLAGLVARLTPDGGTSDAVR
jgi:hypothetical protein